MKRNFAIVALAGSLAVLTAGAARADVFTYAGISWEQNDTPDVLGLLGNNDLLGGAQFSAGNVTSITRSVGFIALSGSANAGFVGAPGFMPELSLGRQANAQQGVTQGDGTSCLFSCAVNMPNGNNGTTARHGLRTSWTGGRTMGNAGGDDFVVYESASNSSSPEGFMVRARRTDGTYTPWHYETYSAFELYVNTPPTVEGVFAHAYDLSDMGVAPGGQIDTIEIANLMPGDRINVVGGFATSGEVVFEDPNGDLALPAATPAANSTFGSGALDPDPLWVGAISAVAADGACCTNGPGAQSECVETNQQDCEAGGGIFIGPGVPCAVVDDCVPLYVELDEVRVTPTLGGVLIQWTTAIEIDTMGFRILRESAGSRDKALIVVLPFLSAVGAGTAGASYQYLDPSRLDARGVRYWLESLDVYGRVQRHGPFTTGGTRQR